MLNIFYKSIYYFRSKAVNWKIRYRIAELQHLYPGRIVFPESLNVTVFPQLHFDQSESKLIFHNYVAARGVLSCSFVKGGIIEIGAHTFFNNNCSINSLKSVRIGADCLFGENVLIYDHNHRFRDPNQLIREQDYTSSPVIIGNNCWIGSNAVILKGITIGDNCVIGANCVIHNNVPANSLVVSETSNQVVKPIYKPLYQSPTDLSNR